MQQREEITSPLFSISDRMTHQDKYQQPHIIISVDRLDIKLLHASIFVLYYCLYSFSPVSDRFSGPVIQKRLCKE
jgi:hypothetical protein